jgi:hypothetical protein
MVLLHEELPALIAQRCLTLGRAHDVREEHRREHSVGSRSRPSARHELLDLIDDRVALPGVPQEALRTSKWRIRIEAWAARSTSAMP